MYLLGLIFGWLILQTITFSIIAGCVWVVCWWLSVQFTIKYVIAGWIGWMFFDWVNRTK